MSSRIKLTDAIGKLLSEDNRDKTLGEVGKDLSDYLVQIKEMVKNGDITYSVLMEEISKYIEKGKVPKPNTVAQLLLGCVEGDEWCPLDRVENEVFFYYDSESKKFVSISTEDTPKNEETHAVVFLTGEPKDIDMSSFQNLEEKGFEKLKIRFRDVSDSVYKELLIKDLEKYIKINEKRKNLDKTSIFMIISFLFIITIIIFYLKHSKPTVRS